MASRSSIARSTNELVPATYAPISMRSLASRYAASNRRNCVAAARCSGVVIAGVSRLVTTTGGVIWKNGEGYGRFFSGNTGTYINPAGEYGTFVKNLDGTYTYTSSGGLYTVNFNSSGYETSKVTADGLRTTMTYSGSELTGIQAVNGGFYRLAFAQYKV